ncbi:MAG: tRNA lysidine(34) synthetase TilS [Candidatus Omnitrophota bacterium]
MATVLKNVLRTIERFRLLEKNDRVLIGVSGGPDSLALMYILDSLKKEYGLGLYVAHLDHMLRRESLQDASFVKRHAERLGIPFTMTSINIKELLHASKGSQEEVARNARLGFLFQVAKKLGVVKIALGHNLDDQAETVLMRIIRGAGLNGLSAMLAKRKIGGIVIIRPLLGVKRKEIELFLRRRKLKPRIDSSNLQDIYFRNKVRNRLMPLLEKGYNANIKEVLSNMAESVALDYDFLESKAERHIEGIKNRLLLRKLMRMHPAFLRQVLRSSISRAQGSTRRIAFQHIKELEELIFKRPVGSIVDLPQGLSAVKRKNSLIFICRNK